MKKGIKKILAGILMLVVFPITFLNLLIRGDKKKEIKEQPHIPHSQFFELTLERNIFAESISRTASDVTHFVDKMFRD